MQPLSPAIKAFERLQPTDGLLITTDHWQRTQDYHRQRQNFHYQSLHQAGIVQGLGVALTPAPETVEARYRDGRWIQVQPGIAIDAQGNPIVVAEPCVFQVQSQCQGKESKTVYIVVNYVDPDELRQPPGQAWVRETYRIVEKTSLDRLDVELCRIRLIPGDRTLIPVDDVLTPGGNGLDLTHRRAIRSRPEGLVGVAQLIDPAVPDEPTLVGLRYLLQALTTLYPALGADPEPLMVAPEDLNRTDWRDRDLLYLPYRLLTEPQVIADPALKAYVQAGGTLLTAVDVPNARQAELAQIRQELVAALMEAETDASVATIATSVRAEIAAIEAEMAQYVEGIQQTVRTAAQQWGIPLSGPGTIAPDHPLRTTPFLFGGWPTVTLPPTQIFAWGGMILLIGDLAQTWGPDPTGTRSREAIRTAHELGINLLYYAWRRRHLIQLQTPARLDAPLGTPADSLTGQVTA